MNQDRIHPRYNFVNVLLIFNAEEEYIVSTSNYGSNGMSSSSQTSFNYDDIVSAKLNSDGDLDWARNINKRQSTTDDSSYISYTSTIKDNDTYFFINASEKAKKISANRIEFGDTRKNKYHLNIIRINQKGDFDYQKIIDDEKKEDHFMVSKDTLINR